jgi:hypothetical protein
MTDNEAKRPWEATRQALAAALGNIDGLLPGSVVIRRMRCGKGSSPNGWCTRLRSSHQPE